MPPLVVSVCGMRPIYSLLWIILSAGSAWPLMARGEISADCKDALSKIAAEFGVTDLPVFRRGQQATVFLLSPPHEGMVLKKFKQTSGFFGMTNTLRVLRYLGAKGLTVPDVYVVNAARGILIMERVHGPTVEESRLSDDLSLAVHVGRLFQELCDRISKIPIDSFSGIVNHRAACNPNNAVYDPGQDVLYLVDPY